MKPLEYTERGFAYVEFQDYNGHLCSLQKSSLASEDCVWLGLNSERMHLTREQAAALLPYLECFVRTGALEEEKGRGPGDE